MRISDWSSDVCSSDLLIVKGVLSAPDARTAVNLGADGIIVSNHGGRQLDGAIAPLHVLPEIVHACPEVPVMMDSGIRRGTDVMKALALGAQFVFLGRPFGYAARSAEHTSELQSLMRSSYAVFCLKK